MTAVIQFEGVSKRFTIQHDRPRSFQEMLVTAFQRGGTSEEFWAVRDLDLRIAQGETIGIIGANGSGKSTILKLIARTIYPTTGRVQVNGRTAALLELGAGFHPDLSGRENVLLNGLLLGMTRREIRQKLDQIVSFAELERFIDSPLKHYSSGMYMRLAFSVAMHARPEIVLVDEILAVGDEDFQQKSFDRIRELQREGVTVLIVSHDTVTLSRLCDSLVLLHDGALVARGRPEDVIQAYHALLLAHHPGFRPVEGAVTPPCLPSSPTAPQEAPAPTDTREEAMLPPRAEGASIKRMQLVDEADQPASDLVPGKEASLLLTVEFSQPMENPNIGFRVRRQLDHNMVEVYTTCTLWHGMKIAGSFEPGQTIDLRFRQRLDLAEGDYLFDAVVLPSETQLAFDGQERTLACKVTWNGEMQGIVDLHSQITIHSLINQGRTP